MFKFRIFLVAFLIVIWNFDCIGQEPQPDERGYIVQVGDTIDDFKVTLLDGTSKNLSEFNAPVIVLNFFASWCVVCRKEIPHIEKEVWQPLKDQGVVVLGIDYKEKPDTVRTFVRKMNISYPVALDEKGEFFNRFARGGVTRNIVLDQNLKIIYLTRLFDLNEFEGMKNAIWQALDIEQDSFKTSLKKEKAMEQIFLNDIAETGKKVALKYQGKHKVHLEGTIQKKRWWGKMDIGISLFNEDIVSRQYDKKTKTLRIDYKHYAGVRIAILPMTTIKVPRDIEKVVIYDVK